MSYTTVPSLTGNNSIESQIIPVSTPSCQSQHLDTLGLRTLCFRRNTRLIGMLRSSEDLMQSSSIMPVLWRSWPLCPSRVIRCSHIVDTAARLLILPPFQPQRQDDYEAASNPRLFITIGQVPITQLGEASYNRAAPGRINAYACWESVNSF